jgi:hypothetical protein
MRLRFEEHYIKCKQLFSANDFYARLMSHVRSLQLEEREGNSTTCGKNTKRRVENCI